MGKRLIIILGGARSGKSEYARRLAESMGGSLVYVATAQAGDDEMAARIDAHRLSRDERWHTVEAPMNLAEAIDREVGKADVVLIDCLTLLTSNVICAMGETVTEMEARQAIKKEIEAILEAYSASKAVWIVVSNEVGMGLVPPYPLGRIYRDELGWANQRLARDADEVVLMIAGLPMNLKKQN
jgi:adenosylcobinamide kinase/adenosylcobinamide-phosphate guanylyltransferase